MSLVWEHQSVAAGFKGFVKTAVPVGINQMSGLDVILLGALTEPVTVESQSSLLQFCRSPTSARFCTNWSNWKVNPPARRFRSPGPIGLFMLR